jgi:soluble cytochrome b562
MFRKKEKAMAKITENSSLRKARSALNGMQQTVNDVLPDAAPVRDGVKNLREDVDRIADDIGALAGILRETASDTVDRGSDYVRQQVSAIPGTPLRKAIVAVIGLCALSYLLGRSKS